MCVGLVQDKAACPMCRCPINPSQLIEVPPEQASTEDDEADADAHPGKAPGKAQRAKLLQSAKLQALLGHLQAAAAGEALTVLNRTNLQIILQSRSALAVACIGQQQVPFDPGLVL